MSVKTNITQIRRGIANNKLKPVDAINKIVDSWSILLNKLPEDSIGQIINDLWSLYYELATSQTVKNGWGYGHNKMWFDARVASIGRLLVELEKKIKKLDKSIKQ